MGGDFCWPSVEETRIFRSQCKDLVNQVIDRTELILPVTDQSPWVNFYLFQIEHFQNNHSFKKSGPF